MKKKKKKKVIANFARWTVPSNSKQACHLTHALSDIIALLIEFSSAV